MVRPFYVAMPSVRRYVLSSLPKWWMHAVEARGGKEILSRLSSQSADSSGETRKILFRLSEGLKRRKLLGSRKFGGEIHFIVVDSSAFYHEKPLSETHTPAAVELARTLNSVGNDCGIFVHYVTSDEINILRGSPAHQISLGPKWERLQNFNPFWSVTAGKGRVFVGPGAAMNIALSFARRLHEKTGRTGEADYWRLNDDLVPVDRPVSWLGREKAYRNVFLDQQEIFDGLVARGGYRGFQGSEGHRVPKEGLADFAFRVYRNHPSKTPYYATAYNDEFRYQPRSGAFFETPDYLVHVGRESTWKVPMKFVFGTYAFDSDKIPIPADERFFNAVLKNSGADSKKLFGVNR